jgi:hypothetical protein
MHVGAADLYVAGFAVPAFAEGPLSFLDCPSDSWCSSIPTTKATSRNMIQLIRK